MTQHISGKASAPDYAVITECHCASLKRASRIVSQIYDRHLAPCGLRSTQFAILAVIARSKECHVSHIAHSLGMDRSTAGQNLRPLMRQGLLATSACDTDKRAKTIALTPKGISLFDQAQPLWQQAQAELSAQFRVDDLLKFKNFLAHFSQS